MGYKQQKYISHSSGILEVQDQDTGRSGIWWGLTSWFAGGHFLTVSSHGGERTITSYVSSYKATNPIHEGAILIT